MTVRFKNIKSGETVEYQSGAFTISGNYYIVFSGENHESRTKLSRKEWEWVGMDE